LFGKANGHKALPHVPLNALSYLTGVEINRFLNKSKNASEFGQKAIGFMKVKMNVRNVIDRPFIAMGRTRILKIHSIGISNISQLNNNPPYSLKHPFYT
jgi:hypothetical protein